ncbi:MarR family winged helix-turn-helix transcriptional regulator [Kineosporia sp. R_H_3]|uniref:MarR family winged helix-turn-helix transcriptional regulator n=1 Tax=Kineosporia sp. R_H_3 TaxID=1961848 RepID=UPI000B4AE1F8|nr:MarR family transcriptional regulator [Kineosporia sp. R_H_3]
MDTDSDTDTTATEPRWLTAQEQAVWRAYLDVTRLFNDKLNRRLVDDADLSLAEYEIMVQLSETDGHRLRMSELADRAVNSRSRLTHTVARMEDRGLVRREACPDDGRGVLCVLTDDGFATIQRAAPDHVAAVRETVFDVLTEPEVECLGTAMQKIRAGLRGTA